MAAGLEPGQPSPVPETAFRPVEISSFPPEVAGAQAVDPAPFAGPVATPNLAPLGEPFPSSTPAPERAQPSIAAPKPVVVPIPTPTPKPQAKSSSGGGSGGSTSKTSHSLSGLASYYCWAGSSPCTVNHPDSGGFDAYAAAGPKLRAALGDWRGRIVYVDGIRVKLIDWCQCYKGESYEKLLDLYHDVFARTGSKVTIRW